jgi:hypothetical protein
MTEPLKNLDDAKKLFENDPAFNKFVTGLIGLMKDEVLTVEHLLTGVALAVGEFENHIEPTLKKPS